MAYTGDAWDETNPTNSTQASEGDDIARDIKLGVRMRMSKEHYWPSSQTGTNEAGYHTYLTFANQTGAPTLPVVVGASTQVAAIYFQTNHGYIKDSAGTSKIFFTSAQGLAISNTATIGAMPIITGSGALAVLAPGASGQRIVSSGTAGTPAWRNPFGTRLTGLATGTAITATADGLVFVYNAVMNGGGQMVEFYKDSTTATTVVLRSPAATASSMFGCTIPVLSGESWKLQAFTGGSFLSFNHEFWPL